MELIGKTFAFEWEINLMVWLQTHLSGFGFKLAELFTLFGEPMLLILIVGLFYWGMDKKFGKYLAVNLFSVCLWGSMVKNIFLRRRPYFDRESIQCIRPAEKGDIYDISLQGYSFPSLHSGNAITLFTLVGKYINKIPWSIILWVIPFLVGVSRFILGVHYPTDVLAGWFLGLMVMTITDLLQKKLRDPCMFYVILLASGIPGFFYCKSSDFYTSYGLIIGTSLAFLFEEKKVNFKPAQNIMTAILRVVIGGGLFILLSGLLKLPFPKELLEAKTALALFIRTVRYGVISFIVLGVYPLFFQK